MFDAGWEPTSPGFLTGQAADFSIVDEVQVPSEKGEYLLSWRWDCEETDQVWNSCADITITNHVPPTPGQKTCKSMENPSCKGTPFKDRKKCWFGGCKQCHDDTTFDCDVCCPGCSRTSKGDIHYCA